VAKRCPFCGFVARSHAEWRAHLVHSHDWDPLAEPTSLADVLVAIGFGTITFVALMMLALCTGSAAKAASCESLGLWSGAGLLSLLAAILMLAIRPIQQARRRAWIAVGRTRGAHQRGRPPLNGTTRDQLRQVDAITSTVIAIAFSGIFVGAYFAQGGNDWWLTAAAICLVIVLLSGLLRWRIRRRLLR